MEAMKGTPLTTYLSGTRLETRGLVRSLASRPRRRRLLTAVRGAAAA